MDSPWPRALGLSLAYSPLLPSPALPSHFLSSMICGPSLRAKEIERKLRWISLPPSLPSVIPYPAPTSPCIFSCPPPPFFRHCLPEDHCRVLGSHSGAIGMLALPSPLLPSLSWQNHLRSFCAVVACLQLHARHTFPMSRFASCHYVVL